MLYQVQLKWHSDPDEFTKDFFIVQERVLELNKRTAQF